MRNLTERTRRTVWGRRACAALVLGLAVGVLSGCDTLLDVDLPAELTDQALEDPTGAETQMVTTITHFEDGFDDHIDYAFARESAGEVFMCGPCRPYNIPNDPRYFDSFAKSRRFSNFLHEKLVDEWTVSQVPDRAQFLAISSIYEGASIGWMGQVLCEAAIDGGPLIRADDLMSMAEGLLTRALSEVQAAGDFAMPSRISSSAMTMTYGLRAQVRWMMGNNSGAMADAQQVPQGFVAFVTRESNRRNEIGSVRNHGGFLDLYDPIDWWPGGTNPETGQAWPDVIPFTGYTFLGIMPDGRAVHDDGIPVRYQGTEGLINVGNDLGVEPDAVPDTRVTHRAVEIQGKGGRGYVPTKYPEVDTDIPLVNWKEMVLIRAEIEGGQGAIDLVNELRMADGLPLVTYADPNNATQIQYMIIEERRRALVAEGRFLQTKLQNLDVSWFPRGIGGTRGFGHAFGGGVRFIMPDAEYINNLNLTTADRGTGCNPNEAPVNIT